MPAAIRSTLVSIIAFPFALGCQQAPRPAEGDAVADGAAETGSAAPTDRIGIAMSAAPEAISSSATIMDFGDAGALTELRPGTNGWLCMPDNDPNAPGDGPICVDPVWQQWFEAYQKKETPNIKGVGISYMLRGGPTASNTDPYATAPAQGEDWIHDAPHIMVIVPDPAMLNAFPTDHASGGPYVMWKGTPYAHLMVPVSTPER